MAIIFDQAIAQWQNASPSTSASFTPGAAGYTICIFAQNESGNGRAVTVSGTGSYSAALVPTNDANGDTHGISYNLACAGGAQTATLTGTAGTDTMEAEGLIYSGVDTLTNGAFVQRSAPGATASGTSILVPLGSVLVAMCKCVDALGPTISGAGGGTTRASGAGVFVSYAIADWAGTGASFAPSFSVSGGANEYVITQFILNPPASVSAPAVYPRRVYVLP